MRTDIADVLTGKSVPASLPFPRQEADLVLGRYGAGHVIKVALTSRQANGKWMTRKRLDMPDIERLDDFHEVWAMCFRKPRPGWRMLGRFVAKNRFVALTLNHGDDLHEGNGYATEAQSVIDTWNALGLGPAHTGTKIEDYFDGYYRDANEKL